MGKAHCKCLLLVVRLLKVTSHVVGQQHEHMPTGEDAPKGIASSPG